MHKPKIKMRSRTFIILCIFVMLLAGLLVRIGFLQIVQGAALQKMANEQQTRDRMISSKRGTIYDRNGVTLAISASAECVSVTPSEIANSIKNDKTGTLTYEDIATELSTILEVDYNTVYEKLKRNTLYEIVKRKVDKDKADLVRAYMSASKVSGINLDEDSKRYYPFGNFASHVIGFTGTDNQGLEGIEKVFDNELRGVPGRVVAAKNAKGIEMPMEYEKFVDPQDGLNVMLTIDEGMQHFAEKHLETAIIENKCAKGGACIVMDVKTGEILAMATKPDYDLNRPFEITDEAAKSMLEQLTGVERDKALGEEYGKIWRNKAVVDTYEPGSTFKIFTSAMALEEKVVSLSDNFYCNGSKKVATHNISCWKAGGHGSQTFVEGVENSCNPVFIEVGERVGTSKFVSYFRGLGFFDKTGIELLGEAIGIFHPINQFNEVELATSSFGQSFQITPLQMISAVSAVANDGYLVRPRIVKALTDKNGNIVKNYETQVVRQVISKETSATLRQVLEKVVSEGTGRNAYVSGYRVAGKTGTSEKLPRNLNRYIASFVGFAPADDPRIACLVILDEPMGEQYFGGVIAGPVVGRIMEDSLRYLNVEPLYTQEEIETLETPVPDMRDMDIKTAKATLAGQNLSARVVGNGNIVMNQIPKQGTRVNVNSVITLYTEGAKVNKTVTVPNVSKCTVAQATQILVNSDLNIKIIGAAASRGAESSIAFRQEPAAGSVVEPGAIITVEFRTLEVGE